MDRFFELAVVGLVAGPRFGLVDACERCQRHRGDPRTCRGFGAGCLGVQPPAADQPASSRIKR